MPATLTTEVGTFFGAYLGQASDGEPVYTKTEWEQLGHRDYAEQRGATYDFFPVWVPEALFNQIG